MNLKTSLHSILDMLSIQDILQKAQDTEDKYEEEQKKNNKQIEEYWSSNVDLSFVDNLLSGMVELDNKLFQESYKEGYYFPEDVWELSKLLLLMILIFQFHHQ